MCVIRIWTRTSHKAYKLKNEHTIESIDRSSTVIQKSWKLIYNIANFRADKIFSNYECDEKKHSERKREGGSGKTVLRLCAYLASTIETMMFKCLDVHKSMLTKNGGRQSNATTNPAEATEITTFSKSYGLIACNTRWSSQCIKRMRLIRTDTIYSFNCDGGKL